MFASLTQEVRFRSTMPPPSVNAPPVSTVVRTPRALRVEKQAAG